MSTRRVICPREDGGDLAKFRMDNPTVKHRLAKMDEYNRFQVNFTTPPNAAHPLGTAGTAYCLSYLPDAPDWEGIDDIAMFVWQPREYRVISGGQVGVDEGALRGAVAAGIATAGCMAKGFRRAGASDPEFAAKYKLTETVYDRGTDDDKDRQNIDNSDLLVAFQVNKPMTGAGTRRAMMYAFAGKRQGDVCVGPVLGYFDKPTLVRGAAHIDIFVVWDLDEENWEATADALKSVLREDAAIYTNVMFSGPLERTSPGVTNLVERLVVKAFSPSE